MTKQQAISEKILNRTSDLTAAGNSHEQALRLALDEVLGAGTYARLVSDVYDTLQVAA